LGQALVNGLRERLPELVLDVLDGIDAKAVEIGELDPARVDVDHRGAHFRQLGRDVLQAAREIAEAHFDVVREIEDVPHAVVSADRAEDARLRRDAVDRRVVDEHDGRAPRVAERRIPLHAVGIPIGVELRNLGDGRQARAVGALAVRRRGRVGITPRTADVHVGHPVVVHVVEERLPDVIHDDVEDHLHPGIVRSGDHRAQARGDRRSEGWSA
jgi:hypothetical protein